MKSISSRPQDQHAVPLLHQHAADVAHRRRWRAAGRRIAARARGVRRRPGSRARAFQRLMHPLRAEGFQQIVQRLGLECLQREAVVGGDEDHRRHVSSAPTAASTSKPFISGICTSRNTQVRTLLVDRGDGAAPIGARRQQAQLGLAAQQALQPLPRQRLVIDDEHVSGSWRPKPECADSRPDHRHSFRSKLWRSPYRRCRRACVFARPMPCGLPADARATGPGRCPPLRAAVGRLRGARGW